jgi:predicted transcriptional regulator of viral defense system
MSKPADPDLVIEANFGTITTAQANAIGISNERLRLLVKGGRLERVRHGVYGLVDDLPDGMHVLQQRRPKAMFSHETALYLHELTDRDPLRYSVTVPRGYNTKDLRAEGLEVYTVKKELHLLGATQVQTVFGNTITAYGIERTICDCIRSRNKLDIAMVTDAV